MRTVLLPTLTGTSAVEVEPIRRHWLPDALRTAPRALLWGTGFGVGLLLVGADRVGALVLEHVAFRVVGL